MSLRNAGLRTTPQHQFVMEALRDLQHATSHRDRHLPPGSPPPTGIAATVRLHAPGINHSTIYSTLDHLEEAGIASRATLLGVVPHYFRQGRGPHLVCSTCSLIECVPATSMNASATTARNQHGFPRRPRRHRPARRLRPAPEHTPSQRDLHGPRRLAPPTASSPCPPSE